MPGTAAPGPIIAAVTVETELTTLSPWYHSIDLGNGVVTPGQGDPRAKFERLLPYLPADLRGLRVIDVGCNAGGVSVEFARRGAHVVGVETTDRFYRQAVWVRDQLGLRTFEPLQRTAYEIGDLGRFDVAVFLGIIYHLRYPQLSLDLLSSICDGIMFLSTPIVDSPASVMENRLPSDITAPVPPESESHYNWWYPSQPALLRMLTAAGFTDIEIISHTARPFVSSSAYVDNASTFPTGQLTLKAIGHGKGSLPSITRQPGSGT